MRRITVWILTTISALVLLFGYRTSTSASTGEASMPPSPGTNSSGSGSSPTTSNAAPAAGSGGTVTGIAEQTRYGPVQVQITVAGGRITAVDVVDYPTGNDRDREINSEAIPTLVDETVQAQSAQIDMVSGATYTSTGYVGSLQSALDKAGIST